ncbi:hypothetical protein HMPREF3289_26490 [Pseudomonas sp. HMSC75E02]|nr:hypothetical protein HMPREF3289_26490 [Pseudomonas sp. HMSC75E02]
MPGLVPGFFMGLFVGASLLANGDLPVASVLALKNALSLTLSLKGEGTVGRGLVFLSQPVRAAVAG